MFNISAKTGITDNEVRGPTVFKRTRDVEFTIFLPFDTIVQTDDVTLAAVRFLMAGVYKVLESLEIDASPLKAREDDILERVRSDPEMIS